MTTVLEPQVEVVKEELSIELRVSNAFSAELGKLSISEDQLRLDAEKAMTITIKDLNDKEGWKQADEARKNLKVKRVTIQKVGKYIRDEANAYAKRVITRQDELVGLIDEAETYLDTRQKEIQAEKDAIKKAEDERIAAIYALRIVELTQMGFAFTGASFSLDELLFSADDVKKASQELYEQHVLTPAKATFEKKEAIRIAEAQKAEQERLAAEAARAESERLRLEAEQKLANERAEMERQQAEFRKQQEEFEKQRREAARIEEEKRQQERLAAQAEEEQARKAEWEKQKAIEIAEKERIAAENAATRERERIEAEQRAAELKKQQEEAEKAERLAQAGDKEKWMAFVVALEKVRVPEVRSSQYRKKAMIAREKQEEILSL